MSMKSCSPLQAKADTELRDNLGTTPLMFAAALGRTEAQRWYPASSVGVRSLLKNEEETKSERWLSINFSFSTYFVGDQIRNLQG